MPFFPTKLAQDSPVGVVANHGAVESRAVWKLRFDHKIAQLARVGNAALPMNNENG